MNGVQKYSVEVDKVGKTEWSTIIKDFKDSTLYQTWNYGEIMWGKGALSHIVVKENNCPIAVAQLRIIGVPSFRTGIAYLMWGPLWRRNGEIENQDRLQIILNAIKNEYISKRGYCIRIHSNINFSETSKQIPIFTDNGYRENRSLPPYRTFSLDLSPPLDQIRKSLQQKWRNQLNRAEKNSLSISSGIGSDDYNEFLLLMQQTQERKTFKTNVSYTSFGKIQADLPDSLKMRVWICREEGKPVASAVNSAVGDTGIYIFGATSLEGLNLKGSYLIQWEIIKWLKENGYAWYDLGGIDPENNPGVYHFKAGLSGIDTQHIGKFDQTGNLRGRILMSIIDKVRNR